MVAILTNDRPDQLKRLLNSLLRTHAPIDALSFEIHIDWTNSSRVREKTLEVARGFAAQRNCSIVKRRVNVGLRSAWLHAWPNPTGRALILEDDVRVSPHWYA